MFEKMLSVTSNVICVVAVLYLTAQIVRSARIDFWFVFGLAVFITVIIPAVCRFVYRILR